MENINVSNFNEKVLNSKGIVLVDFWAVWCGPCRMISPILTSLSEKNTNIQIYKVDVDENNELSIKYNVNSIPTILFFKDGVKVDEIVGAKTESFFQNIIDKITLL